MSSVSTYQSWIRQSVKVIRREFWIALAFLTLSTISIAAVFWIFAHSYGTNWDETQSINRVYRDAQSFQRGGVLELIRVLLREDRSRPSAFRILVLPVTLFFGVSPTILRILSLMFLWVTFLFTYLAGKRIAGSMAGGFTVAFLAICPILIEANMRFYVDYPLYLAIAAMLYFLFLDWNSDQPVAYSWMGLGIAMGLGGLAKPTIVFIAAPIMLLTLLLSWRRIIIRPSPISVVKASGLAFVVMLPWWVFNFKLALTKAFSSGRFFRHSLGPKGSVETLVKWLYVFAQSMLGPALTLLTLAILITFVVKLSRKRIKLDVTTSTAIAVCLAGALPLLIVAAFGTNHNVRLIAPTLFPLALAIGIIATATRWTTSRSLAAISAAIVGFQLTIIISSSSGEQRYHSGEAADQKLLWGNPTTVMLKAKQWDWSKLRKLCQDHQIPQPSIAYLGNTGTFNIPQITYPWIEAKEEIVVTWLWNYEKGLINWDTVMKSVDSSDVVLTIPGLVGNPIDKQYLDNQHNADLLQRLQNNPQFSQPVVLQMEPSEAAQVLVFFRKHL
jgi:4-amino-4-deoxy-L-arabinose transferase-like glycosyltransferase